MKSESAMDSLWQDLKNAADCFNKISVTEDYTAEEREVNKNKVTEGRGRGEVCLDSLRFSKKRDVSYQVYKDQTGRLWSTPICNDIHINNNKNGLCLIRFTKTKPAGYGQRQYVMIYI